MANGTLAASQIEMLSQSGTGIITITPPATNTNRAITLPDAAGAIVVSGTTPSLNGIAFPATQVASADANTLDDYEEGTWTPNQGSGLVVTGAFSSVGKYTKIGRMVYVSGEVIGATSITFSAGATICTNLPFSATTSPQQAGSGVMGNTASGPPILAFNTTVFGLSAGSGGNAFAFNIAYSI